MFIRKSYSLEESPNDLGSAYLRDYNMPNLLKFVDKKTLGHNQKFHTLRYMGRLCICLRFV